MEETLFERRVSLGSVNPMGLGGGISCRSKSVGKRAKASTL